MSNPKENSLNTISDCKPLPSGLRVKKSSGAESILLRPALFSRALYLVVGFFVLSLLSFVAVDIFPDYDELMKNDSDVILFTSIGAIIFLVVLFRTLISGFTAQIVILGSDTITVKRRPIPFFTGTRKVDCKKLIAVEVETHRRGQRTNDGNMHHTEVYEVQVSLIPDKTFRIIICDERDQAEYVSQRIIEVCGLSPKLEL